MKSLVCFIALIFSVGSFAVPAPTTATFDLKPATDATGGIGPVAGVLTLSVVAKDATTYSQTFNLPAGASATAIRDTILTNMQGAGWNVVASGTTAIIVKGTGVATNGPVKVSAKVPEWKPEFQPSWITTGGVKRPSLTPWSVTFDQLGSASTLLAANTLNLALDSYVVSVSLTVGMSLSQVVSAVNTAMHTAGFSDATIVGNSITFMTNPSTAIAVQNFGFSWNPTTASHSADGSGVVLTIGIAH